uniref:Endonuclease/exonuclease/phosphatase domain-containing protein n=1 Tax=Plectus sambesii TaxID=2011161 RepID=A0A914WDV8_9BILA
MLRLIQVYAPTLTHNSTIYNAFLNDVSTLLARRQRGQRFSQTIIMGDSNAKIGMQQRNERALGRFGFGVRNERGERLADFCNNNRLFVLNTLFCKAPQRKWTWRSPNGATKNEIDYIISNDRRNVTTLFVLNTLFCKAPQRKWTWRSPNGATKNEIDYIISNDRRNVTDVSVLSSFNTGSNYRLIRATFNVTRRLRPRQANRDIKMKSTSTGTSTKSHAVPN